MHKKIHVKTKNKICAAVLVFVLAGSLTAGACAVPNVYAKTEAEKKRDAYKKKLKAKNSDIANIKDSQSDVKDMPRPKMLRKKRFSALFCRKRHRSWKPCVNSL